MGTIKAQTLIDKVCADILNDTNKVRFKQGAALNALNEGQRVIASLRPDAYSDAIEFTLAAGAHQRLPANCQLLLEPMHNGTLSAPGNAITPVESEGLDAVLPGWRASTKKGVVKHVIYDSQMPQRYIVFPPALPGTKIVLLCGLIPSDIVAGQPILLDDTFEAPLCNYMLARAFEKSGEYAGDPQRSAGYYGLMREQLGLMAQAQVASSSESDADAGTK